MTWPTRWAWSTGNSGLPDIPSSSNSASPTSTGERPEHGESSITTRMFLRRCSRLSTACSPRRSRLGNRPAPGRTPLKIRAGGVVGKVLASSLESAGADLSAALARITHGPGPKRLWRRFRRRLQEVASLFAGLGGCWHTLGSCSTRPGTRPKTAGVAARNTLRIRQFLRSESRRRTRPSASVGSPGTPRRRLPSGGNARVAV